MTNVQGLYLCLAVALIVGIALGTIVVRRNRDEDYGRTSSQRAARTSTIGLLLLPLFIVLGIAIMLIVLLFQSP